MPDRQAPSFPLLNRGPEALQAKAVKQVSLLTRTELEDLAEVAHGLARVVRGVQAQTWPRRYGEPVSPLPVIGESDDGILRYNPATGSEVIPDHWTRRRSEGDRSMTNTDTEPTLPGLPDSPEPEPLWAVHNQGADEIIAQASRKDAELFKALLDELDADHAHKPEYPTCAAEIIPWPWSREEHAEALRREAEEN